MKTPILGGAYVARSVNAADNRMVNLFPEIVPEGGKEPAFLQRAPGTARIDAASGDPVRGLWVSQAYPTNAIVVVGDELYRFASGGGASLVGNVSAGTSMCTFADLGEQVLITTSQSNTGGYVYDWNAQTVTQVTDAPDYIGGNTCAYLTSRAFIAGSTGSDRSKIQCSDLLDPLSWDPLNFANAESSPDGVVGIKVLNNDLWVFGTVTTEVWGDAGLPGFPLTPIGGAAFGIGCMCYASIATIGGNIFWLGRDQFGQCIIYKNNGYGAARISTHAIEWQIQQYATPEDAVAYVYQQNGHTFYVINFTGGNATWVYDVATEVWHERATWDGSQFNRHFANCAISFKVTNSFGTFDTIVGSYIQGDYWGLSTNIYADSMTAFDTYSEQKWLRSWRALGTGLNTLKRSAHHSLQLDCESGVYSAVDPTYDNGVVSLRWSDDGGHTWSTPQDRFLGGFGETGKRVIWRRLGMTMKLRDRVYEVSGVTPNKMFIMGAELIASLTNA